MARRRNTALDKARSEIITLHDMIRNGTTALTESRRERDDAFRARDDADDHLKATMAHLHLARQRMRRLLEQVLSANLRIARREGYIDRVREAEAAGAEPAVDADASIDLMRSDLLNATTDRQVGRVLDGLDDETIAEILGRVDEPQG